MFRKSFKSIAKIFKKSKDASEITNVYIPNTPNGNSLKTSPKYPDWEYIADKIEIDSGRERELVRICDRIRIAADVHLLPVQEAIGVPWEFLGAIFYREASLDFKMGLHCGQPWNEQTSLVPVGRGPFPSWQAAAIDALVLKGFHRKSTWSFGDCLARAEAYNGLGYRAKGIYSPYVTAGTNFSDEKGRYVADHKFDPNAAEKRLGVAAILIMLGYKFKY